MPARYPPSDPFKPVSFHLKCPTCKKGITYEEVSRETPVVTLERKCRHCNATWWVKIRFASEVQFKLKEA